MLTVTSRMGPNGYPGSDRSLSTTNRRPLGSLLSSKSLPEKSPTKTLYSHYLSLFISTMIPSNSQDWQSKLIVSIVFHVGRFKSFTLSLKVFKSASKKRHAIPKKTFNISNLLCFLWKNTSDTSAYKNSKKQTPRCPSPTVLKAALSSSHLVQSSSTTLPRLPPLQQSHSLRGKQLPGLNAGQVLKKDVESCWYHVDIKYCYNFRNLSP